VISAAAQTSNPYEQGFAWTASPSLTNVPAYVLYHTTNAAALSFDPDNIQSSNQWQRISVTNFAWTNISGIITNYYVKTNFVAGVTNWVLVTARDISGVESVPSNVIHFVPPKPPTMLRLIMQTGPTPTGPWKTLTNVAPVDLPAVQAHEFTRLLTMKL